MARIRTIKPEFFTHDVLAEVEPLGQLLFIGLWCVADREGRLEYRPKRLKAELLPYDACDIDGLVAQLADRGFVLLYEVDGRPYIQIEHFTRHQCPNVKERESTIPAPYVHDAPPLPAPHAHVVSAMTALQEGKEQERNVREDVDLRADAHTEVDAQAHARVREEDSAPVVASPPRPSTGPSLPTAPTPARAAAVQPVYAEGSEPMVLAARMCDVLRASKPDVKLPRDLQRWARDFDLMLRVDHRPREKIEAVMAYAARSPFWRSIVLSPGKLREKFDTLDAQREEDSDHGAHGAHRHGHGAHRHGHGAHGRRAGDGSGAAEVGSAAYYEQAAKRGAAAATASGW